MHISQVSIRVFVMSYILMQGGRSIYEFYAQGSSYEELHAQNRASRPQWSRYAADTSFRFLVTAYKHTIPQSRQREVMESFDYMRFMGKIDMKNPDILLGCFEECAVFSF